MKTNKYLKIDDLHEELNFLQVFYLKGEGEENLIGISKSRILNKLQIICGAEEVPGLLQFQKQDGFLNVDLKGMPVGSDEKVIAPLYPSTMEWYPPTALDKESLAPTVAINNGSSRHRSLISTD